MFVQGYQKDTTEGTLLQADNNAFCVYLRWDDPYSYLLVQQIADICEDFPKAFQDCQVLLSSKSVSHYSLSSDAWQAYALTDAQALAKQHRFDMPQQLPNVASCAKASQIFGHQQPLNEHSLHLLLQLFHMVWFGQQAKLNTLLAIHLRKSANKSHRPSAQTSSKEILVGYMTYKGNVFEGLDGLRYLLTVLKADNKLPEEAAFFIDHIDWQDDLLINDPELVREIHELKPQLELFVALEDPRSWFALDYLMQEIASHYHIKLKLRLLPYQGLDDFDWKNRVMMARRMGVNFAPFSRPTEPYVLQNAQKLYHYKKSTRNIAAHELFSAIWTQAKPTLPADKLEAAVKKETKARQRKCHMATDVTAENVTAKLEKNQRIYDSLNQPTLPSMRLTLDGQTHVWSGLKRIWRLQTLLADHIEDEATDCSA